MLIAILILVIISLLVGIMNYVALSNQIQATAESLEKYYDRETMRVLTAMYNREANIAALKRGEEVEI